MSSVQDKILVLLVTRVLELRDLRVNMLEYYFGLGFGMAIIVDALVEFGHARRLGKLETLFLCAGLQRQVCLPHIPALLSRIRLS